MSISVNHQKILIMAGGTGGHVFPALAVANELRQRQCEVAWLGTASGIESKLVPAAQIPLYFLTISGLRGKDLKTLISSPWRIFMACLGAYRILKIFRPNVILGMGGYASGPGGLMAKLMGIPLVVHEQNAKPGTTNKWLAKMANRVLTAFPDVFPGAICIGNPVRVEIANLPDPELRMQGRSGPLRILVLGGSLGAKALNELIPQAIALLDPTKVQIRHQTGTQHLTATQNIYAQCNIQAEIFDFIDNMAEALTWADLVICRAGALTIAELSAAGVGSILIPFPFAIDDHQTANGQWLVNLGAAQIRQQKDFSAQQLKDLLEQFLRQPELLVKMAKAARTAAKPDATRKCADICLEVANGKC
jgi:UDP-N-acetylglucosamine--N-acetylmuramyl-(pentapeptide) pyrophosphoryl-undecaprenol N-acetylglucosamine transferase